MRYQKVEGSITFETTIYEAVVNGTHCFTYLEETSRTETHLDFFPVLLRTPDGKKHRPEKASLTLSSILYEVSYRAFIQYYKKSESEHIFEIYRLTPEEEVEIASFQDKDYPFIIMSKPDLSIIPESWKMTIEAKDYNLL